MFCHIQMTGHLVRMKKIAGFAPLTILLLTFFACNLQIPSAVRIKGNPVINIPAKIHIGVLLTDLLIESIEDNEISNISIIPCVNTQNLTYLLHMDLVNELLVLGDYPDIPAIPDLPPLPEIPGIPPDIFPDLTLPEFPDLELDETDFINGIYTIKVIRDIELFASDEPVVIPLLNAGDFLKGFYFSEVIPRLYFYGTGILEKISVGITINDREEDLIDITPGSSNRENWGDEYTETTMPAGGVEIDIPFDGNDITISFRVFIPAGETLTVDDFDDGHIAVEFVVWLPFVLKAGSDEVEFEIPSLFDLDKDLFNRSDPYAENIVGEMIQSLSLDIIMSENLFEGTNLIVRSVRRETEDVTEDAEENDGEYEEEHTEYEENTEGEIEIVIEILNYIITGNSLSIKIDEEAVEKINAPENYPFAPRIVFKFKKDHELAIPRNFNVTEIVFKASIDYVMEF